MFVYPPLNHCKRKNNSINEWVDQENRNSGTPSVGDFQALICKMWLCLFRCGDIFLCVCVPQRKQGLFGCRSCSCRRAWRCPTCASSRTGWRGSPRRWKGPRWIACTSPHTARKQNPPTKSHMVQLPRKSWLINARPGRLLAIPILLKLEFTQNLNSKWFNTKTGLAL